MRQARGIVIAVAVVLSAFAIAEVRATHTNALGGDPGASWAVPLRTLDEALARKDVSTAVRASHDAYGVALGSRRWEGLIEVGDAELRVGEIARSRKASEARARELYLAALFRARHQGSLDGVLRAGEAFAALGDREVAEQCFRIAEGLVTHGRAALADGRLDALRERVAARSAMRATP